ALCALAIEARCDCTPDNPRRDSDLKPTFRPTMTRAAPRPRAWAVTADGIRGPEGPRDCARTGHWPMAPAAIRTRRPTRERARSRFIYLCQREKASRPYGAAMGTPGG